MMVAILLIASVFSFGQIKMINVKEKQNASVGKLRNGYALIAEIEYVVLDKDTIYTLSYQDNKYQYVVSIKSLDFNNSDNAFEEFYKICKSVFTEQNRKNKDYSVFFTLGGKDIMVVNSKLFGLPYCRILIDNTYTAPLTENQVDKLFGYKQVSYTSNYKNEDPY